MEAERLQAGAGGVCVEAVGGVPDRHHCGPWIRDARATSGICGLPDRLHLLHVRVQLAQLPRGLTSSKCSSLLDRGQLFRDGIEPGSKPQ